MQSQPDNKQQWGTPPGHHPGRGRLGRRAGQLPALPGQRRSQRRRRLHDPLLHRVPAAGHPDRLGRVDHGPLRRAQGLPLHAGHHGRLGQGPVARYLGAIGVLVPLVIYFYYVVIESWCLRYACALRRRRHRHRAGRGRRGPGRRLQAYFADDHRLGLERRPGRGRRCTPAVVFWLITFALNIWFVFRGLSQGHRDVLPLGHAGHGRVRA